MIKEWLQNIFNKRKPILFREWRTDNSIFHFLSIHIDDKGNLSENGRDLPDEKKDDKNIRIAGGLIDVLIGVDDSADSKTKIAELTKHLKIIAHSGDKISEQEFYRIVKENEGVIGIIDQFLQSVIDSKLPTNPHLFNFAQDLATKTDNRNAVKYGIAILGLCNNRSVLDNIKTLGLHDEFTVYSTVAIMHLSVNVEQDLWELAQKVNGWGRIQLVDRLARLELNDLIKDWLIFEGYKNNIMYEYLAYTCATYGELHKKLERKEVEKKLFKSASDIIEALIVENSPAEDIACYSFASQVI